MSAKYGDNMLVGYVKDCGSIMDELIPFTRYIEEKRYNFTIRGRFSVLLPKDSFEDFGDGENFVLDIFQALDEYSPTKIDISWSAGDYHIEDYDEDTWIVEFTVSCSSKRGAAPEEKDFPELEKMLEEANTNWDYINVVFYEFDGTYANEISDY